MPKWRVSFEVDLKDNIPAQNELKPHDYPLETWAAEAVHDMVFAHALTAAQSRQLTYLARLGLGNNGVSNQHMVDFCERQIDICRQARDSATVELLPDS